MTPGSPTLGGLASVLCISVSSWEVAIYTSEVFQKALESKDNLWIHVFHHRGEDTWVESTDNMIQTPTPPQIYSRVRTLLFCRKPDAAAGQRSQTQTERHQNRLETTESGLSWTSTSTLWHHKKLCETLSEMIIVHQQPSESSLSAPFSHCDDTEVTEEVGDRGARTRRTRFCSSISLEHCDVSEQRSLELFKLLQ